MLEGQLCFFPDVSTRIGGGDRAARKREWRKRYRAANREKILERERKADRERRAADPEKFREQDRKRRAANPKKFREQARKRRVSNFKKFYLDAARRRAKKRDIEFTIAISDLDWPTHCPVLGIKLEYCREGSTGPNSASIDRIDNTKGYVPGNVSKDYFFPGK